MIARIAARGHSFKGAGLYYLHDKEASTTERVAWTQVRNLPTQNPEAATNYMAYTAINSNKIKQEAGIPLTGRKREKGVVYTFSLSWSPEEKPTHDLMVKSADETLEVLGLQDHQSLIVAHNDTKHPHIHVICNLISPKDGKMYDPDWGSKLKMSDWSLKHEYENGKVYCDQRVENHEKRKRGERVKYQEPLHDRKAEIQQLYNQSDSGKAFSAALEEQGYSLAKGNRRRFVLVDKDGRIHSLSRQLDKEQKKMYLDKLSDLVSKDLPIAKDIATERQYFDRDKQTAEQEQKIIDAAIDAEQQKQLQERKEKINAKPRSKKAEKPEREGNKKDISGSEDKSKIKKPNEPISNKQVKKSGLQLAEEQSRRWDKIIEYDRGAEVLRSKLKANLEKFYNRSEVAKEAEVLRNKLNDKQGLLDRIKGQRKKMKERLLELEDSLKQIDERIKNENGKLEKQIQADRPVEANDNTHENEPTPEMNEKLKRKEKYKEKYKENIQSKKNQSNNRNNNLKR
ncbi:MAG: relaxase/mobilization nuclease domain-containing protein [Algicola sp.]|nr:relaxase/mobilization nuclease domain-containing protein [Algicola sp.]